MRSLHPTAQQLLSRHWADLKKKFSALGRAQVTGDRDTIFAAMDDATLQSHGEQVGFYINPVVFNLPERATHTGEMSFFVVVRGFLYLDADSLSQHAPHLKTRKFATEVAYFKRVRSPQDGLVHVYGAHYDFDASTAGHPVFHLQMKNYIERVSEVHKLPRMAHLEVVDNPMERIFDRIRIPTAQVDVFSLFLQLSADHLMHEKSGKVERSRFFQLRDATLEVRGAGYMRPALAAGGSCMRSGHWY